MTAGNASPLTDGAAAVVVASAAASRRLGLPVLAVVRASADANQEPEWFTTAPALAIPKVRLPPIRLLPRVGHESALLRALLLPLCTEH